MLRKDEDIFKESLLILLLFPLLHQAIPDYNINLISEIKTYNPLLIKDYKSRDKGIFKPNQIVNNLSTINCAEPRFFLIYCLEILPAF